MKAPATILLSILAVGCLQPVASLRGAPQPPNRNLQSDPPQQDLCASIIAIALTPDPSARPNKQQRTLQKKQTKAGKLAKTSPKSPSTSPSLKPSIDESIAETELGEQFVCERSSTGELLPLLGSEEQMVQLRDALTTGVLISAETTIEGLTEEDVESVELPDEDGNSPFTEEINDVVETAVTLPAGELKFKPGNGQNSLRKRSLVGDNADGDSSHRNLAVYKGTKKVLLVRVTDSNGLVHPDNAKTMSDKLFGNGRDDTNFIDQFKACSYGDMKFDHKAVNLGNAKSADGVIQVKINISLKKSSRSQIQAASKKAAEAKLGRSLPGPWDHVMFSIEGCYTKECGWAAYAGVNTWFSVYQGNNYKFPAVALHEIGHNLNLAHSGGDDGRTYTDHSCLMGNPWFKDDVSAMCFNPAKSYQLSQQGSWYSDRIVTWNSGSSKPNLLTERLVGIADYGNNPRKDPVIVKLESGSSTDVFVGFNRKRGINSATKEGQDMVTVVEQGGNGNSYATSVLLATLKQGQSHTLKNWQKSGKKLIITVRKIQTGSPWFAEVDFNFNGASAPGPQDTPRPTPLPTPRPTPKPTPRPTPRPTNKPNTPAPTKRCGDSVCMADETDKSCPADCVNAEFATYDLNIGAKGANGTMFQIQAMRDVEINSLYTFVRATNEVDLVQVYSRKGSYAGFEKSDVGWDLVFDDNILLNGRDQVTELSFRNKIEMSTGEFRSFYVYSPKNLAYREEPAGVGDIVKSDSSFRFFAGIAIAFGKFGDGKEYSPRVFSGLLSYNAKTTGSFTTEPSASPTLALPTMIPTPKPTFECGDGVCGLNEHSNNCAIDCRNLPFYAAESGTKGSEGIMFTVKAKRDVIVNSFDVYGVAADASPFQVYTKVGSWIGHEATPNDWTLVYNNPSLEQKGRNTLISLGDIANGVTIPAGTSQSFYLFTPTKLMYDVGDGSSPYSDDNALELYEGIGVVKLFADGNPDQNTVSPRVFAGTISYDIIEGTLLTSPPTSKPSAFPTALCGNAICDVSEDSLSCPVDCQGVTINVNDIGAKGAPGAMFSIKALRGITVKSLEFFSSDEATSNVLVYTRPGSYQGYTESSDGWELVYNASVAQLGRKNITSLGGFDEDVVIPSDQVQSFLIYSANKVMYKGGTNDTSEGALFSSDNAILFYEGIGLDGPLFSSWIPYTPRVFRGSIIYDVNAGSSPSSCGDGVCADDEHTGNCPSDCLNLSLETTDVAGKGAKSAMFSIKALRDISITSLDFFGATVNTDLVQVFTRGSSYDGHQYSSNGWRLVYDNANVNIKGKQEPTPLGSLDSAVYVSANATQSFYIYSPSKVMYRAGKSETSEGTLYKKTDAFEFYEGVGIDSFFAASPADIYSPRVWRGVIRYNAL